MLLADLGQTSSGVVFQMEKMYDAICSSNDWLMRTKTFFSSILKALFLIIFNVWSLFRLMINGGMLNAMVIKVL